MRLTDDCRGGPGPVRVVELEPERDVEREANRRPQPQPEEQRRPRGPQRIRQPGGKDRGGSPGRTRRPWPRHDYATRLRTIRSGSALAEIGHRRDIVPGQLRRHRKYPERVGLVRPSRFRIAELPAGDPLDLKIVLRSWGEGDRVGLTGGQPPIRLYREGIGPRGEIPIKDGVG